MAAKGWLVRTDGGDGRDDLAQLQLVEDGRLSGSVKTDHENSHFLLAPEAVEYLANAHTHGCGFPAMAEGTLKGWMVMGSLMSEPGICEIRV